jgi:SHS2 domain-containing protein
VGFRAWGTDLADLFETAARAMFSLEYDVDAVPQQESPSVAVQGDDLEGTLYAWLSELLWLHDAEGFALSDVWVDPIGSDLSVRGVAIGAPIGDWFRQVGPQLKAVTMHELEVVHRPGDGYEATVYLDV